MKIFLLADYMENGGAETHIYELSRLLSQKGHSVIVFSHGGKTADKLAALGIRQIPYGTNPLFRLARFLQEEKPTIVHAHTRKSAFLCRILLCMMDFPFVFTAHARFSSLPTKRLLSFFPPHTIAVSEDIAEHLSCTFGVPRGNISVIGNGINTGVFCSKRDISSQNHILTVSRLDADCSLTASLLCQLAPMLFSRFPDLRITIIGGGSELARVRALAQKANLRCGKEVVRAVGARQNVLPYLQSSSLFVGVSRAALEAMSCSLPVILSGDEGYLGIAEGHVLRLAEKSNFCARGYPLPSAKRLFEDICLLLTDKELATRAAKEARGQVLLYHTAEQMVGQTLRVYAEALRDCRLKRKSDILLCGYYGYGNLGDELTLRAISEGLRKASEASALSSPLRLAALLPQGKEYKGLTAVDRLDLFAVLDAIRHTGLLVLGGGSLLQNKTSNRSLFYYLFLLELAHIFALPTMLYASGIGPIYGRLPLALCERALHKADIISVRDKQSFAFLKSMGIKDHLFLSADPVLSLKAKSKERKGYVLAFVREEAAARCFSLLEELQRPIYLAVMDPKSDLSATKKLAARLQKHEKNVLLFENISPRKLLSLIAAADLVVSARLHALILSLCTATPFIGVSDDPKILAFCRAVYDGLPRPITRGDISSHFPQKQKEMAKLAEKDVKMALNAALCPHSFQKSIDKKTKK